MVPFPLLVMDNQMETDQVGDAGKKRRRVYLSKD
jgi:hypothetical protein